MRKDDQKNIKYKIEKNSWFLDTDLDTLSDIFEIRYYFRYWKSIFF